MGLVADRLEARPAKGRSSSVCRARTPYETALRDDDPAVRATLEAAVASDAGLQVVARAGDAAEETLAGRHLPDVAIVDFRMPGGGAWAAKEIARVSPGNADGRSVGSCGQVERSSRCCGPGWPAFIVKGASCW